MFLEINGVEAAAAPNDEVVSLVIEAAGGDPAIEEIAAALRRLIGAG